MSTRLKVGTRPIRQNKNITASFMIDFKLAKRMSVFHLVDLEGNDYYVMKMTSKYMINMSHSDKPMLRYLGEKDGLIEYTRHSEGHNSVDFKVGNYVEVNAEIHI
jgi:hypothetical protein